MFNIICLIEGIITELLYFDEMRRYYALVKVGLSPSKEKFFYLFQ